MAQTVQIRRTTTNNAPATLPAGSFSVELGAAYTRLWMGDGVQNRLLTSSNPADVRQDADVTISATPPTLVGAQTGVLWFDTVSGALFLRFNDGTSTQWISPASAPGPLALQVGPGLSLNNTTSPPTIDVVSPYLRLTGGVLSGPGNLQVQGGQLIGTAGSVPGTGALTLNANTVAPPAGSGNGQITVVGADASNAVAALNCFGSSVNPFWIAQHARGTAAAPAALQQGDVITNFSGIGYRTGGWGNFTNGSLYLQTVENFTATAQGTQWVFTSNPPGTTATVNSLVLAGNSATFSGSVAVGGGTVPSDAIGSTIVGANASNSVFATAGSNNGPAMSSNLYFTGSAWKYLTAGAGALAQTSNNSFVVYNAASGAAGANATINTTMSLTMPAGTMSITNQSAPGLQVNTAGNTSAALWLASAARTWDIESGGTSSGGTFTIYDITRSGVGIQITSTGSCLNTTGTWGVVSDTRAKTKIEPYLAGLQAILALEPISYDLITDDWHGDGLVGFRAEEVAKVLPELCGTQTIKLKGEDTDLQTVAPTGVVFALVNACKELKAANDALAARLAALEGAR